MWETNLLPLPHFLIFGASHCRLPCVLDAGLLAFVEAREVVVAGGGVERDGSLRSGRRVEAAAFGWRRPHGGGDSVYGLEKMMRQERYVDKVYVDMN